MGNFKIKLDKFDRKILAEMDKNCRVPLARLSKKVKRSRQSIEYRIDQLVKKKVISGFSTAINPHKLGFKVYKTYLQLKNVAAEKNKLIEFLRSSGNVYWYGECDGEWDLIFGLFADSDYEYYRIRNEMTSMFGNIILKQRGTVLLDSRQYPKMYFTGRISEPVVFGGEISSFPLRGVDKKILAELIANARVPVTELAKKVGSTPAIVRSRMNKLENAGIIIQYRINLDLERLGLVFFKSIIHTEYRNKNKEGDLISFVSRLPSIQYFIRNLWDAEIELVVRDYLEYNDIVNGIKEKFPDMIRNIETVIMKSDVWMPSFVI